MVNVNGLARAAACSSVRRRWPLLVTSACQKFWTQCNDKWHIICNAPWQFIGDMSWLQYIINSHLPWACFMFHLHHTHTHHTYDSDGMTSYHTMLTVIAVYYVCFSVPNGDRKFAHQKSHTNTNTHIIIILTKHWNWYFRSPNYDALVELNPLRCVGIHVESEREYCI